MHFNIDYKQMISLFISCLPLLLFIIVIVLIIYCIKAKVRIKFKSFKGKSFRPSRNDFGLFCYVGAQGKGKTYSLIEYLLDHNKSCIYYSNITNIKNVDNITYYRGFSGLIKIKHMLDNGDIEIPKKKQLVIIFDEIFTELQKGDKLSKEVLDFLCQMRKRKIIFLTTCQYWAELPLSYRRFCRYQIDCNMFPFLWFGILKKTFRDAELMKWDNDEQDFVAPITETTITKCRLKVANSYDTFLRISPIEVGAQSK